VMQNLSTGGISVGTSRTAVEMVYNTSKKTSLTITNLSIVGANPDDFSIPAADLLAAASTTLPSNQGAAEIVHVMFAPTAEGVRTAAVQFTSAAGVVQVALTGIGLPLNPVLGSVGPFVFIPTSAPANMTIQNTGGATLALNSISIGGANPEAFELTVANNGFSNCFAGVLLGPKSFCQLAVGVVAGATPPASGSLVIISNDPASPETDISLTLTP
jgi:hypothetical protein